MEDFGAYLRREREAREVTLDEVARVTRISRRFLEALESGRTQDLPEPTFVRGFLRAYAEAVGLDGNGLVLRYESECLGTGTRAGARGVGRRRAVAIAAAVALLAAATAALIWFDRRDGVPAVGVDPAGSMAPDPFETELAPLDPTAEGPAPDEVEADELEPFESPAPLEAPVALEPMAPTTPAQPTTDGERDANPLADLVGLDSDPEPQSAP